MALVVNTNVTSLIAQRRLDISSNALKRSMERLSSGLRINRASDDAAGLSISQNLVSQIKRMRQASRNTGDGISVLQVAEGSLSVIGENLQRIRELAVQAANDTYDANARAAVTTEIRELTDDMNRVAAATNFNGLNLLDGTYSGAQTAVVQIGTNSTYYTNVVDLSPGLQDARPQALGLIGPTSSTGFQNIAPPGANPIDIIDHDTAILFLGDVDRALQAVNSQRGVIGSLQNKLESVTNNLEIAVENFSASNSRIRDVDVAAESAAMTQSQILTQAATMILSQTNNLPQMVLRLLENQ